MSNARRSIRGRRGTGTRLVVLTAVTAMALAMLSAPAPAPATPAPAGADPHATVCDRHQGDLQFDDVAGHELRRFIDCLGAIGVVAGKQDGSFDPSGTVTRGQLASFVVRAMEIASDTTLPTGGASFTDVHPGSAHTGAILKLVEVGIIQGYPDGTFQPAAPVTREQAARFVAGAFDALAGDVDGYGIPAIGHGFEDVAEGSRYDDDISLLFALDIIGGYRDGTFGARDDTTRAQMAKFVANMLERVAGRERYVGP